MKLKDLNEKQVVQTTKENHDKFMKLLDKEGFKWCNGQSYGPNRNENKFDSSRFYNVKKGMFCERVHCVSKGYEIIPASKFLKLTKKELLERIERIENHLFVPSTIQFKNELTPEETKKLVEDIKCMKPKTTINERDNEVKKPEPNQPTSEQENRKINFYFPFVPEPTEPKQGDLCAFADELSTFDINHFIVSKLENIKSEAEYKYVNSNEICYRFARKVEIKFI